MGHLGNRSRRRNWTRSAFVRSWSVSGPVSWHSNWEAGTEKGGWWMAYPVTRLGFYIPKDVEKTTISQGTWSNKLIKRRGTIWWTGVILIVVTLSAVNGGFIVVIHDERNEECSATCILLDILVQGYSSDWRTWFQASGKLTHPHIIHFFSSWCSRSPESMNQNIVVLMEMLIEVRIDA